MTKRKIRPTWNKSFTLLNKTIKQAAKLSVATEKKIDVYDPGYTEDVFGFECELKELLMRYEHRRGEG